MRLDNEITMLKVHLEQAAQQSAAVDVTLKETNYKVCFICSPGGISLLHNRSFNLKPTGERSSRKNYVYLPRPTSTTRLHTRMWSSP